MKNIQIQPLAEQHFQWVESKNWHNKTALESIALIGSEIGEALAEAYDKNQDKLKLEVADIYLRCMDFTLENRINMDELRSQHIHFFNELDYSKYGNSNIEHLAYLNIPLAKLANTTRYTELHPEFKETLAEFILSVEKFAEKYDLNLYESITQKIQINLTKNHKNRIK